MRSKITHLLNKITEQPTIKIGEMLLDYFIPHVCFACGSSIKNSSGLCYSCWSLLSFIPQEICKKCGKYLVGSGTCISCQSTKYYFDQARAIFNYNEIIADLIIKLKYHDKPIIGNYLAKFMLDQTQNFKIDVIFPVPIARMKLFSRTYNQSAVIAKQLTVLSGIKSDLFSLIRTKNGSQRSLTFSQRKRNVKGVFKLLNNNVQGKRVLIVDDVTTTFATLNECARVLRLAGASKIFTITVAMVDNKY